MDPILLADTVAERYRDYLRTTFAFKDPDLRQSFERELAKGFLTNGPYLEALPRFVKASRTDNLFRELLGSSEDESFLSAMSDRRLYGHQEEAIRRVDAGSNLVVATGTGSGKTEAFLYPILLHLHKEFERGDLGAGVRALILYPMNALANDQRDRLSSVEGEGGEIGLLNRIARSGSSFSVTFGQYIGETPWDERDAERKGIDLERRRPGELITREEMREAPPHVLLTNYSMLEYLLLRPDDAPLFDAGSAKWWRFLVLDEAHQYRGSRGTEMAMLVRRLKQRLREGGRREGFTCIATSATLVGGLGDRTDAARFASDLFGEPFDDGDVILAAVQPSADPDGGQLEKGHYALLDELRRGVVDPDDPRVVSLLNTTDTDVQAVDPERIVGEVLLKDRRSSALVSTLTHAPQEFGALARQVFPELSVEESGKILASVVELLRFGRDRASPPSPLLVTRYHLFVRSLEGAFATLSPEKRVVLNRTAGEGEALFFELALCRECGQHYLVGDVQDGKLVEAVKDPSHASVSASYFRPIEGENGDVTPSHYLCLRCGLIGADQPFCGHDTPLALVAAETGDEDLRTVKRCGACGYGGGSGTPVVELLHGADGPHSVIVTTLYKEQPSERRKILAFADGRQEAAFFAWYLQDTYEKVVSRNVLYQALVALETESPAAISLGTLVGSVGHLLLSLNLLPRSATELDRRRRAWLMVYREFLTKETRLCLEGVGLVSWRPAWPPWFRWEELLALLPDLDLSGAQDLLSHLFATMRQAGAVDLPTEGGIRLGWDELDLLGGQTSFRLGSPRRERNVRSWDGARGRRGELLDKVLRSWGRPADSQTIEALLRRVWKAVVDSDQESPEADDCFLTTVQGGRRLNPWWWRVETAKSTALRCETCGRLYSATPELVCPRYGCPGRLTPVEDGDLRHDHYRRLYEELLPSRMRVEEHTAQLSYDKAREFQRDFRKGRIHVLSCSTTFELGVDLGNLDIVFLRNVPPEAFNYVQRVGRAGRRGDSPGIAVTFCRRNSHDLYHFNDPLRMLAGKTSPPSFNTENDRIVLRHLTAAALSEYFRANPERFGQRDPEKKGIGGFVGSFETPAGVTSFRSFLLEQREGLSGKLAALASSGVAEVIGLPDGDWVERLAGPESRLALGEAEVVADYTELRALEHESSSAGDHRRADWAQRRLRTVAGEPVLNFLSRKAIIPKYGFPVDVVELDTSVADSDVKGVSLQRDLGLATAEFAPGSSVVANKWLWESHSLKRVPNKEWRRRDYVRCSIHGVVSELREGEVRPQLECGCASGRRRQYVVPEFGFSVGRKGASKPSRRPIRSYSTRPYFVGMYGDTETPTTTLVSDDDERPLLELNQAAPGRLLVLCEGRKGRGFYICAACGAGFKERPNPRGHRTRTDGMCTGSLANLSLGHDFVTDVVRVRLLQEPEAEVNRHGLVFSLTYALLQGAAERLEVPDTDLNATVAYADSDDPIPAIVLYDNVPGGAGLVAKLAGPVLLRRVLEASAERVSGSCGCGDDASCYGCLRTYRNQFVHPDLRRGLALDYLLRILERWPA